jgi:bromodomain-containing factor 1
MRRQSTSVPTIRRSENEVPGRPKREIHPPPPKDLPYADAPRKSRKGKKKDDGTVEQLKYCSKILTDFSKQKKYWPDVAPFMEPVGKLTRMRLYKQLSSD